MLMMTRCDGITSEAVFQNKRNGLSSKLGWFGLMSGERDSGATLITHPSHQCKFTEWAMELGSVVGFAKLICLLSDDWA